MPTLNGWKLLAFGVAAALTGRALAMPEFYVMSTAALSVVLLAMSARVLHPSRLAITRRADAAMVAQGEHVRISMLIANRDRLKSPTVRIREYLNSGDSVELCLAPLSSGSHASGHYLIETRRRGVLTIGPSRVEDIDGLGLARRRRLIAARTRIVVHPPVIPLDCERVPVGEDLSSRSEIVRRNIGLDSDDFDILRPYVSGDDPRHIHWRSTAHFGEPMVRRFQPSRPGRLTVVIDTRPPADAVEPLDAATAIAAAIVCSVLHNGDEARLMATDGRCTLMLSRSHGVSAALEFLALLSGGDSEIGIDAPADSSVVVAVSASEQTALDETDRNALVNRLNASQIITCAPADTAFVAPGVDAASGWIHLNEPSQLRATWRMPVPSRNASMIRARPMALR